MKKLFYFAIAAATVLSVAACDEKGKTPENNDSVLEDDGGSKLTADVQKSKLEETANLLMTDLDQSQWEKEYDLVEATIDEMDAKELDYEDVSAYMDAIVDAWDTVTGVDPFTTTTTLARLTDIKGHWTENAEGSFDFEDADDLQISIFSGGKKLTATFSAMLSGTVVTIDESESWSEENGEETSHIKHIIKADVPTEATLGLKQDDEDLAFLTIRLNYQDANGNEILDNEDKADVGFTLKVGAYEFSVDQVSYATENAFVSLSLKKDDHLVLGARAMAAYKIEEYQNEYSGGLVFVPVSGEAQIDIEGKIQLKGNLPEYSKVEEAKDAMDEAYSKNDFEAFKKAVYTFEKSFGIGLYYDGGNTLQATLGFEPIQVETASYDRNADGIIDDRDKVSSFTYIPVVRFADGTTYGVEQFGEDEQMIALWDNIGEWVMGIYDSLGLLNHEEEILVEK
ncbi:MAG: hypothetical protein J5835_04255 [Bacteroidales bacterium]|nr:hypothetical protein [Bacteroidales bacterium]